LKKETSSSETSGSLTEDLPGGGEMLHTAIFTGLGDQNKNEYA
jgi:hypothetical protein